MRRWGLKNRRSREDEERKEHRRWGGGCKIEREE